MKRLWLKVPGFQVHDVYPRESKDGRSMGISVRLGDVLDVKGIVITESSVADMSQNWAMANTRFSDVPIIHRKKRKKNPLLEDVLAMALVKGCWAELGEVLLGGLEKKELGYVRPWMWLGQSLRIPVDFIRLQNLYCPTEGKEVYADFRVGHHLIIWQVLVYDGSKFVFDPGEKKVVSKELRILAHWLMKKQSLRRSIKSVSERASREMNKSFTFLLRDCDPGGIPPAIRFY